MGGVTNFGIGRTSSNQGWGGGIKIKSRFVEQYVSYTSIPLLCTINLNFIYFLCSWCRGRVKENLEKDGNKDKVKGDYGKRTSIVQRSEQENL